MNNLKVSVPGSCGELVQGIVKDELCLITCPINLFSSAIYSNKSNLKRKTRYAIKLFLKKKKIDNLSIASEISIKSQLLLGKGMASSSADIASVLKLTSILTKQKITERELASIATQIEPTDGIFCRGIVAFNYCSGRIFKYLGMPPKLSVVIFDSGNGVNTIAFNKRKDLAKLNQKKIPSIKKAFESVCYGIKNQDIEAIGYGATLSAFSNQIILPKKHLSSLVKLNKKYKGVGVCVAHSGTVLGALFEDNPLNDFLDFNLEVANLCPQLRYVKTCNLISGGFYYDR